MVRKSRFLIFWTLFTLAFVAACSAITETLGPTTLPNITHQVPTAAPQTNPLFQSTPSIEPSPSSSQPPIKAPNILHCEGDGSPAIVLNIGCSLPASQWNNNNFYQDLTKITQTCYYQRDKSVTTAPNTLIDMVDDLHTRITNAQISPPYVVLGHSCAGWIVIRHAYTYPDEVAGLILLDSSAPDFGLRALEIIPTASPDELISLTNFRNMLENWYTVDTTGEGMDFFINAEQVREVTSLGDIPMLVLTASAGTTGSGIPEITQQLTDDWLAQQKELATLSTNGRQVTVENTGHIMWRDNPSRIISLIRAFIQQLRSTSP